MWSEGASLQGRVHFIWLVRRGTDLLPSFWSNTGHLSTWSGFYTIECFLLLFLCVKDAFHCASQSELLDVVVEMMTLSRQVCIIKRRGQFYLLGNFRLGSWHFGTLVGGGMLKLRKYLSALGRMLISQTKYELYKT